MATMLKTAIPDSQSGFEEILNDQTRVSRLIADGEWAGFLQSYQRFSFARDPGLKDQLKDAMRDGWKDFLEKTPSK